MAVIYGINGTVLTPLPSLKPEAPSWIASSDGGIVISDLDNSRLIFTDDSLRVVRASKLDSGDSPIDVVNSITTDGNLIYVTGAKTVMRGGCYSSRADVGVLLIRGGYRFRSKSQSGYERGVRTQNQTAAGIILRLYLCTAKITDRKIYFIVMCYSADIRKKQKKQY